MGDLRFVVDVPPMVVADVTELQRQVADLAELVARQNRYLLRALGQKRIPPLYDSGLVYRSDPWGPEFQHVPNALTCLERGWVDCKGAVPYRLAQLREEHPDQLFGVHTYPRRVGGDLLIHQQIRLPGGTLEDPSRFLRQA
jgi:hypothetical protein